MIRYCLTACIFILMIQGFGQYTRSWGTYYGGTRRDELHAVAVSGEDAVYVAGWTQSDGAGVISSTTGAHQVNRGSTSTGSSGRDGMLVKFNGAGVRQWATYYGGNQEDLALAIATDASGNVYIAGHGLSTSNIATAGSHKSIPSGYDAFLIKFNANGVRQWGTYYGGGGPEEGRAIAIDAAGNVFLAGITTGSITGVATDGAHQTTIDLQTDAFLVKFNADGVRQWGTYYGGVGNDFATGLTTDQQGNVILCGYTNSNTKIATPGSHQPAPGSFSDDGFIVKFNADGVRQWGTYYGGTLDDIAFSIKADAQNNLYVAGNTLNTSAIATPGSHQSVKGGNTLDSDAFLLKLNADGVRQWATYYGGDGGDGGRSVAISSSGSVAIAGNTTSGSGIATSNGFKSSAFGFDGFMAVFGADGTRQYGTYYGGTSDDNSTAIAFTPAGAILMVGQTLSSGSAIATDGAHQPSLAGDGNGDRFDGFVVKFSAADSIPTNYTFTGNGNWSNAANWQGGTAPPATIPTGVSVVISPGGTDECVIDVPVTFAAGASLQVPAGKRLRIVAGLSIQ